MNPPESNIRVEALSPPYMKGALRVQNNFIGSGRKRLCCLIPLTFFPTTSSELESLLNTEDAMSLSAVAIRESDNKVVGFVHMTDSSTNRDMVSRCLHTIREGECYIELLNVLPEVRGQGIGTLLLNHCEERARERGAQVLTLGVVDKNPAKRLYERFGFVDSDRSVSHIVYIAISLFCIFGFPHWGCGGTEMEKDLQK